MKKPVLPNPPLEPKKPLEEYDTLIHHDQSIYDGMQLNEVLKRCPKDLNILSFTVNTEQGYYDDIETYVKLIWTENKHIVVDDNQYNKLLKKYDKQMDKYHRKLEQYKLNLETYKTDLEEYKEYIVKEEKSLLSKLLKKYKK